MGALRATSAVSQPKQRTYVAMGSRRYDLEIRAPFNVRLKTRLERAITHAILNPSRALPTLRRAIIAATRELRAYGYADTEIERLFAELVEDVARARSLDSRSIVSGQPRWLDLCSRLPGWIGDERALPHD